LQSFLKLHPPELPDPAYLPGRVLCPSAWAFFNRNARGYFRFRAVLYLFRLRKDDIVERFVPGKKDSSVSAKSALEREIICKTSPPISAKYNVFAEY
jgi:hypothetical protein